jgi:plasmid maintenance system killer protein
LKRIVKINHELNRPEEVKKQYGRLLKDYLSVLVTQEKALNNLLDALSDSKVIKDLYDMTLEAFEKKGNKVHYSLFCFHILSLDNKIRIFY